MTKIIKKVKKNGPKKSKKLKSSSKLEILLFQKKKNQDCEFLLTTEKLISENEKKFRIFMFDL